jgi:hypothetical protein
MIEWPLAELIDRLSILMLKRDRSTTGEAFAAECDRLEHEARHRLDGYRRHLVALLDVNARIWDLESDIRAGKEGRLGLEEVGRRALAIRDINAERIALKNAVARLVGEFADVKVDHASAAC